MCRRDGTARAGVRPDAAAVGELYEPRRRLRLPLAGRDRPGQERRQDHRRERPDGRLHAAASASPRSASTASAPTTSPAWPSRSISPPAGTLVATTRGSLERSHYALEVLEELPFHTPLGPRRHRPRRRRGQVEVSGPTTLAELRATVERLQAQGADAGAGGRRHQPHRQRLAPRQRRPRPGHRRHGRRHAGRRPRDHRGGPRHALAARRRTEPRAPLAQHLAAGARAVCLRRTAATPRPRAAHSRRRGSGGGSPGGAPRRRHAAHRRRPHAGVRRRLHARAPAAPRAARGGPRRHRARPAAGQGRAACCAAASASRCSRRCACWPSRPTPSASRSRTGPRSSSTRSPRPSAAASRVRRRQRAGLGSRAARRAPDASLPDESR